MWMWMWMLGIASGGEAPEIVPIAQVRPRIEAHTGRDGAEGGAVAAVTQRVRLGAEISTGAIGVTVAMQDVRIWGEETNTLFDFSADQLDLHLGSLSWTSAGGDRIVVGRQEVTLHEQRLVGPVGWTQQGRSFDGAFASVSRGNLSADVGGAVLTSVNADPTGYDSFFGMIRAGVSGEGSTLDLVYLPLSDASRDRLTHTAGVYTKGSSGPLQGRAEVYLQAGTRDGQSEMAWLAGLSGTLAPEVSGDPKVTLWYDYLSGDGDPGDGRATAFDTLFATNHKFYGLIDVMAFSVGGVGDGQGLQDAALKLSVAPDAAIRTHLDAHLFLPSVGENAMLGQEVDLWGRWKVTEGLGLSGGGAALLRSDAQADLWSFLQLDANL